MKLDSAEVVHGLFSMKGKIDSVQMVTLYMDEESIMPIVLESGKITVTISNTDLKAVGTSLNNALYEFISKRNQLEKALVNWSRRKPVWYWMEAIWMKFTVSWWWKETH